MDFNQSINMVSAYEKELSEILSRFEKKSRSININLNDDPRFRQLVVELIDFFNDVICDGHKYSSLINQYYVEGISNFSNSPSYHSVESILGVISAAKTRIERNPEIIKQKAISDHAVKESKNSLEFPDKVTLKWLYQHVPVKFWVL